VTFDFKLFFRLIYITFFESKRRNVHQTPQRLLILAVFLLILAPGLLLEAAVGWLLDKALFPGHREQEVREPVFIIGNPRSGTTFLHRLLARDEATFNTIMTWELSFAPTITQRRLYGLIGKIDRVVGRPLGRLVDAINSRTLQRAEVHPMGLFKAEEDDLILLYTWNSTFILGVFPYPDEVLPEILTFDQHPKERKRVMRFYEGCLKRHLYAHEADGKHFLSKNPVFSSRVDALYETFPDAKFIYLVRNPVSVLGSLASYARMVWKDFQGAESEFPYDNWVWESVRTWYRYTLDWLDAAPPENHIIVRFDDMVSDPWKTITEIYEHFGFDLGPEFDEILKEQTIKARQYRSKHAYSLEEPAFTREQILEEYGDLFDRFGFSRED
jgi:hypothetical protein